MTVRKDRRSPKPIAAPKRPRRAAPVAPALAHAEAAGKTPAPLPDGALEAAPEALDLPEFLIVGIGASAGGLEACSQLLSELPQNPGMALVIVQHLSPAHESMLPELLARASKMPVVQITDGIAISPDHVYVIPPNTQIGIIGGKLRLLPRPKDGLHFMPIDFFFHALADYAQTRAVGIVLSGTASDGAAGLGEIKGAGGITMAQDPQTARHDGMPRAAIAMDVVDIVLPVPDIARELVRIGRHPFLTRKSMRTADEAMALNEQVRSIFQLLRRVSGIDFSHYKYPTIKRRLQRRMMLHKLTTLDEYLKYLRERPPEINHLCEDLLIHVTRFFREPESFKLLAQKVFPKLMENRPASAPIRVWIPGCATGEEAYSVAIALSEFLDQHATGAAIQIFATDVSETAIEHARQGMYPENISAHVSADRLRKYFSKMDGGYRIAKRVRDTCIFARQDLAQDPPFSMLDLIVCRNVLIYLGVALQNKLIGLFHYALKPVGFLVLGAAETAGTHADLFAPLDRHSRVYAKRISGVRHNVDVPQGRGHVGNTAPRNMLAPRSSVTNIQDEANRIILSRYSPAAVIVDANLQIMHFRGPTSHYLEPPQGEASLNLLKMAREGLMHRLRVAFAEARKTGNPATKDALLIAAHGANRTVNLHVVPLAAASESGCYLVIFEDVAAAQAHEAAGSAKRGTQRDGGELVRLRQELAASRDYLQSIIQDMEAANEELQSANEEILSSNEELQSTNEELDTAKEELQSTNEELNTVNDELQGRNEELSRVNSDLVNLIGSVQVAIVMVSSELQIRRFTPMAEKLLNLIPADVGRSIRSIQPNFDCPDLDKLLAECIDTIGIREREVQDRKGHWYNLHIRPYKDLDNRINGAILVLFDIDAAHRLQEGRMHTADAAITAMRLAKDYAEAVINTVRHPLVVLSGDLKIKSANKAFAKLFGTQETALMDRSLVDLLRGEWKMPEVTETLARMLANEERIEGFQIEHKAGPRGPRRFAIDARRVVSGDTPEPLILLAMEDITGAAP